MCWLLALVKRRSHVDIRGCEPTAFAGCVAGCQGCGDAEGPDECAQLNCAAYTPTSGLKTGPTRVTGGLVPGNRGLYKEEFLDFRTSVRSY